MLLARRDACMRRSISIFSCGGVHSPISGISNQGNFKFLPLSAWIFEGQGMSCFELIVIKFPFLGGGHFGSSGAMWNRWWKANGKMHQAART